MRPQLHGAAALLSLIVNAKPIIKIRVWLEFLHQIVL